MMKRVTTVAALMFLVLLMSMPVAAQWENYPTPGIPRTVDGQPNLSAPAPRTADGKPDLSGIWRTIASKYTLNVVADLKPGKIQPWAAAASKQGLDNFGKDETGARCLPPGPKIRNMRLFKIVQTPSVVVLLHEANNSTFSQILTDGRELPKDPNPAWLGYSVGHWEGETLVVETAGFNDKTTLDAFHHPHTEALHITEHFRRRDFGHLAMQITFDDPKAYTRPWTITVDAQLVPDTELLETVCNENNRDFEHLTGKGEKEANIKISLSVLAGYAGVYQLSPGHDIVVALADDRLMVDYTQGRLGMIPLVAETETTFMIALGALGPPMLFEFIKDTQERVTHLVWHRREGDKVNAVRTNTAPEKN